MVIEAAARFASGEQTVGASVIMPQRKWRQVRVRKQRVPISVGMAIDLFPMKDRLSMLFNTSKGAFPMVWHKSLTLDFLSLLKDELLSPQLGC